MIPGCETATFKLEMGHAPEFRRAPCRARLPAERLSIDPADLAEIKACSEASLACSKRVQQALQVVAIRSNNLRMIEIFRDASDDIHPLHLHRHSFELTRIGGKATAGVIKDVVMLGGLQELEFDFVADNPGLTLFHCHQQLHMDFGFMALFNYA